MKESLFETYRRLCKNVSDAKASVEEDPSLKNKEWLRLMTNIYYDFCVTFTENMMAAVEKTVEDTKYM